MNFSDFFLYSILKESIEDDIGRQQAGSEHHMGKGTDSRFWGNRGAGILIRCSATNRYLLGLRSKFVNEPNTWGTFGGMIDAEEDPKEAAMREVGEEIGYTEKLDLQHFDTFDKVEGFVFYNFLGTVSEEFQPKLSWETSEARWFARADFPPNLHFGLKRLVPKLH